MISTADEVRLRGFSIVSGLASAEALTRIKSELSGFNGYAARDLLRKMPSVREFAWSESVIALMRSNPRANCLVSCRVDRRINVPGYQGWSMKGGLVHVQPPTRVPESMAALCLHLDNCAETNGALRDMPGTHLHGHLSAHEVQFLHSSSNRDDTGPESQ